MSGGEGGRPGSNGYSTSKMIRPSEVLHTLGHFHIVAKKKQGIDEVHAGEAHRNANNSPRRSPHPIGIARIIMFELNELLAV